MLKDKLINNHGFTIARDTLKDTAHTVGYYIALPQHEVIKPLTSVTNNLILNYIKDTISSTARYIGGWYNEKDGMVYLDNSIYEKDLNKALALAKKYNQLAIYDIANGTSIYL